MVHLNRLDLTLYECQDGHILKMGCSPSAEAGSVLLERTVTEDAWERSVPVRACPPDANLHGASTFINVIFSISKVQGRLWGDMKGQIKNVSASQDPCLLWPRRSLGVCHNHQT